MIEPRRLLESAGRGPVVLDAAMGTRLIALGLNLDDDDPCLWNLTRPEAVAGVHALDVSAGADALLTNTFGANRRFLSRFGRAGEVVAINRRAAAIAREAAGASRFVIGSIGPTSGGLDREQAETLAEAGVDALVFETFRYEESLSALIDVRRALTLPLIVSLHAWPEPVEEAVRALEDLGASAIGGNCQSGMAPAIEMAGRLSSRTRLPVWIKPAAGLPGESLESPESFAAAVPDLLRLGVRFLGGCCGTTEAHVAALRAGGVGVGVRGDSR